MNESLRNKLIKNEWAEDFDVDDLVKLIENHYTEEATSPGLPGVHGQWISYKTPPTQEYTDPTGLVQMITGKKTSSIAWDKAVFGQYTWRPYPEHDPRPVVLSDESPTSTHINPKVEPKISSPTYSRAKLVHITRTIDPKTRIHYLDAIDEDGKHYMAQMTHQVENWITYCVPWKLAPQFPVK